MSQVFFPNLFVMLSNVQDIIVAFVVQSMKTVIFFQSAKHIVRMQYYRVIKYCIYMFPAYFSNYNFNLEFSDAGLRSVPQRHLAGLPQTSHLEMTASYQHGKPSLVMNNGTEPNTERCVSTKSDLEKLR